jgi:hypothetical protein
MTEPDHNNPTCFEAFHDLGAQKQWKLYRNAIQQRDAARIDRDEQRKVCDSWVDEAVRLSRVNHRQQVKLRNRAALIWQLWRGMEEARAWLRGEFREELGDPASKSWACLYCGEMLHGREDAKEHVQHCPDHPLVKRIQELEQQIADPTAPWNNA